jgi:CopG family nickel-responsive transcriptional regulator
MKRISLALDDELYKKLELAMATLGETNRSRFVASLIAEKVAEIVETPVASVIVIVYDHEVGEVSKALIEVQHDYRDVIRASTHVHLDERNCLEAILAVGAGERIRELVWRISRIGRGLRFLRIVNIPQLL